MTRGILYLTWGDAIQPSLERSIASVKHWHPELPVHVERLQDGSTLLDKAVMYDRSPFDETLFLDADTVVMGDLRFGFEQAAKHGLAGCICECPWARRFDGLQHSGDIVEYNTGVLFFTKNHAVASLFDSWKRNVGVVNSRLPFILNDGRQGVMELNDQASFAASVSSWSKTPAVLPLNWNFRPIWHHATFGPVKIWHDYSDPPERLVRFNKEQSDPEYTIRFVTLK